MQIDIITIFPDYLAPLGMSLLGKARQRGLVDLRVHDLREHTDDVHRTVDDAPFGGGPGMVMAPEPWARALQAVLDSGPATMPMVDTSARHTPARSAPTLIVPTPAGRRFDQVLAAELADEPWLAFACGRYEGIDARVAAWAADRMRVEEVSLGDYVLAGGEVAALVMIEAVTRLLPGVVGNPESVVDDSHSTGLLEAPAYTRPASWRGYDVPPVLLSGDHAAVARWRAEQSRERTADRRPDLLPPAPRLSSTPGDVAD